MCDIELLALLRGNLNQTPSKAVALPSDSSDACTFPLVSLRYLKEEKLHNGTPNVRV